MSAIVCMAVIINKETPVPKKIYRNLYSNIMHDAILIIFSETTKSQTSTVSQYGVSCILQRSSERK